MASSSKTTIAFVVLTWNSEEYVQPCLDSILGFADIRTYVHVVDNGSTDSTVSLLRKYENDERVRVNYLPTNMGTTISRNIALKRVPEATDAICILDSDTQVNESAFATMMAVLRSDRTIGVLGPTMSNSAGEVQLSGRNLPSAKLKLLKALPLRRASERGSHLEIPSAPIVGGLQDVEYLLSACWLMPKEVVDEVGYLDEKIFYAPEDVDYCVRVQRAGYRVVRCYDASILHEYQRISKKKLLSRMNVEHIKGLAYYFSKYGYLFDSSQAIKPQGKE